MNHDKQTEALKLALEALESCNAGDYSTGHVIHPSFDKDAVNKAIEAIDEALAEQPAQQQEPVSTIRALTNQCAALIQERDELQKQVWRYEKNGVTCQTYQHKINRTCSECNVQEDYTSPPASKPLTDEQISSIWDGHTVPVFGKTGINPIVFARAIEAAHGIKE